MLQQLEIHNVALIDCVSFELGKGLNVLTGETGAGKSMIIDSINAILGERVSKELIRTGKDKASVEAVFQVENGRLDDIFENLGIKSEEDGTLILAREFSVSGKNVCRVNGKMVTVSTLKEIGERIIDIHGQHDNQSLLRTEAHVELLDAFRGESIQCLKHEYLEVLSKYRDIKSKLKSLHGDKNERARKIDLLKYQIDEIRKAKLKPSEEEELNKQRTVLANSEKIIEALSAAYELLFAGGNTRNSACDNMKEALHELTAVSKLDDKYDSLVHGLEDLTYQMDDMADGIRNERDNMEYSPELLEKVDERLDLIFRLRRKYGSSIQEVMDYCKKCEQELDELERSEETAANLEEQLVKQENILYRLAKELNTARFEAASLLENGIGQQLDELEMKNARFKADIEFNDSPDANGERKYTSNGLDRVEFLISPNAGEPLKPLSKIASGGEMSRVMLAIKTILADVDEMPTLIFDEIDIGVSGRAAQKVGEKLSYISNSHQVICVTHLTQIACMADDHYLIQKVSDEENTRTFITKLDGKTRINEIARLLAGSSISELTIKHAEELLENAQKTK